MQKKYGAKGLRVVSVSADQSVTDASAFAKEVRATFPVLHDTAGKVHGQFGVLSLPANLVVDRKGKIVYSLEGDNIKALEAAVAKAVASK
jgi:cytochrome c biogenesis protein CcmG, thiol:disulfide interchange protein DsbE